jgi:NAD-dependent histone deacetylase SIR2
MIRNLHNSTRNVEPTRFHDLVARLATEGRLLRLYTQNVDGIDTSIPPLATQIPLPLKGPWPKTVQLHGGLDKMTCTKCHEIKDFEPELFDGPIPPECGSCKERDETREAVGKRSHGIGRLRPRMVLYHEHNPDDEAIGAVTAADLRTRPDAVIVVGTTLKVPGVRRIVREMCNVVRDRRDGFTVWINNDPEPTGREFEDSWDMIVQGTSDGVARLANLPGWNEPDVAVALTPEEVQQISSSQTVAVALPPTPRQTPATTRQASPSKMQVLPSIEMEQWRTQAKKESTSSRPTSKTKKSKAVKLAKASVQQKKPTTKATSAKRAAAKPNAKLNFPVTKPVKAPPQQKRKPSDPTDKKEPLSPSAKSNALPPPIKITLKLTTKGLETEGSRKRTIEA